MSKPQTLLMSYIVCDLLSKSDQTVAHEAWVKIIEDMHEDFKKAGALRQTVSQIWNRKGTFKLGFMWEYKDEKAFNACQKLFRIAEAEFVKKTGISWRITPTRGIVLADMQFLSSSSNFLLISIVIILLNIIYFVVLGLHRN